MISNHYKSDELEQLKIMNMFESSSSVFIVNLMNSSNKAKYFTEASVDSFKEQMMKIFEKILKMIKDFCKDIKIKISTQIQKIQLNKKLAELKDLLAKKRAKAMKQQFNYFDIRRYKKYYTQFINRYVTELKAGLNKKFKTVEEYEQWKNYMMNKLSDFNFKLSDDEQWRLSVSINSAVKLSTEEAENKEANLKLIEDSGSKSVLSLQKYYKSIDVEKSFVNYNRVSLDIFRLQNSFIGTVCSKLWQAIRTVVRFVFKHTISTVLLLIAALIAL